MHYQFQFVDIMTYIFNLHKEYFSCIHTIIIYMVLFYFSPDEAVVQEGMEESPKLSEESYSGMSKITYNVYCTNSIIVFISFHPSIYEFIVLNL